ncbi:phosphopantetheine-binding protein [Zhenpiania hominis]|uniref:phosphopantetheine-binding protein n=1 Tax=Zhenpiania hominis TaxID=2763644 RepID=UPI0039F44C70
MRTEELKKIEEILDVEENTISEETELASLEEWDSVAKLSLTIMLEEDYGKKLTSEDLKNLKTVKMILDLMK